MAEPPAEYLCPITMMTMADPVVTADGQTYERSAIEGWLLSRNTSPATGAVLRHKELAPNFALRKAIETWEETTQMRVPRADIEFPQTRPIGAGAFKTVYKGFVRILGKRITVAVLLIREESCETEVQTFLKLGRHPRLVRLGPLLGLVRGVYNRERVPYREPWCLSFSSVPGSEFISEQENRAENPMKFPWFCGGATL